MKSVRSQSVHDHQRKPAAFLDRDGVLNVDSGFVHSRQDFLWVPGAIKAVQLLKRAGLFVFVVTNQSGIGRGYFTESQMTQLHDWMNDQLAISGGHIDAFYHCPYHGEAATERYRMADHPNRKPNPGMILAAMHEWPVNLKASFLIGDGERDMEAAQRAGIAGYRFCGGNLDSFVREILVNRGLMVEPG